MRVRWPGESVSTFLLGDEVLNNDVSHAVSEGVAILVQAVNRAEDQLKEGNGAVLTAHHLHDTKKVKSPVTTIKVLKKAPALPCFPLSPNPFKGSFIKN